MAGSLARPLSERMNVQRERGLGTRRNTKSEPETFPPFLSLLVVGAQASEVVWK